MLLSMIAEFRDAVSAKLASADVLEEQLAEMSDRDWNAVAEIFAARLPEFDAVIAMPDAEVLAKAVAKARGVPLLTVTVLGASGPYDLPNPKGVLGEAVMLTRHLQQGLAELSVLDLATEQGLEVKLVGAAIERTNLGARARLEAAGIKVRAVVQLADTPQGLVFERRTQERWDVR